MRESILIITLECSMRLFVPYSEKIDSIRSMYV